jgi:tetratricopeptide (TPR) repeat protein
VYDRHAPFGQGEETTIGVLWSCPDGHGQSLDICPIGPLVPEANSCLNCGAKYPPDDVCGLCGLSRQACPGALGLSEGADGDPTAAARSAFAQGLFRRGMAILNGAIRDGRAPPEAWFGKSRLLHSVGYNRSAAEMIEAASRAYDSPAARIEFLEEAAFLWAECGKGEQSLRSADAALALGSGSLRTHYLRGRALALVGRLEEARVEMANVLGLDPDNADARRGLGMIDAALRPTVRKPWWKVW